MIDTFGRKFQMCRYLVYDALTVLTTDIAYMLEANTFGSRDMH